MLRSTNHAGKAPRYLQPVTLQLRRKEHTSEAKLMILLQLITDVRTVLLEYTAWITIPRV